MGRYVRTGQFPERTPRKHASKTDRFTQHLRNRWDEGCQNAAQLARELRAQGFTGLYYSVRRRVARWRVAQAVAENTSQSSPVVHPPSTRRLAWLFLKEKADLDIQDQTFIKALFEHCPDLASVAQLAREFGAMVRDRRGDSLDDWIQRAGDRVLPRQFRSFATTSS